MDLEHISELLRPFLAAGGGPVRLAPEQLASISTYVDLLMRWNARISLTAVRQPDAIITRHFGESLFLAARLVPGTSAETPGIIPPHALDLGSGAGFPGLPLKIYSPRVQVTLLESNHKKAAFLNEVIRALGISGCRVVSERIEGRLMQKGNSDLPLAIPPAGLVTMRAVEHFEAALTAAAELIRRSSARTGGGKLALLIGLSQAGAVPRLVPDFWWSSPLAVPQSRERVLLVGQFPQALEPK